MVNNDKQCPPDIVEYFHKRRKSSSEEEYNYFSDEVLVEILSRLSHSKYVIQCQIICKRWADLIYNPYFFSRFIASKLPCLGKTASNSKEIERSFVIVASNVSHDSRKGLMMHLENPLFNIGNFTLSPLPSILGSRIVAAHNDLVLSRGEGSDSYHYNMYNLQTRQWFFLPSAPFYYGSFAINGFICDPYYSIEGGKVTINEACRFSIVVAPCPKRQNRLSKNTIHLFSSHSKQWTTKVLVLPRPCQFYPNKLSFAFDGKLHFRFSEGMIGFDPYEGENSQNGCIRSHFIGWPSEPPNFFSYSTVCVGVRQGKLQVASFSYAKLFSVWVLEDYEKGEWSLVQRIAPGQWISRDMLDERQNEQQLIEMPGSVLAQHPLNPDIIYMFGPPSKTMRSLLMCNTSLRTVKVLCDVPKSMRLTRGFNKYSTMLPVWPTPFPTLV